MSKYGVISRNNGVFGHVSHIDKIEWEGSSSFWEGLQLLPDYHNNRTCIYQSIFPFIEQMVNLNESKKGGTKFSTKPTWNEKILNNRQFDFLFQNL